MELLEKQLYQNHGNALISTLSINLVPLPVHKPMVITLLEGGEEPWIPDACSPEEMVEELSPDIREDTRLEETSLCN
ncbi:hypothetical protein CIB84_010799 [Bambusicola thoracicus]|uniref:KRAB domain-containing protein n=1 Tax=Bambusicola thoracicus TaxID=9083 RepID=A0A2P4SMW5_BAMTH|nr:hypothetical protein CIB84_010799 [Bambusicola thoracicus]